MIDMTSVNCYKDKGNALESNNYKGFEQKDNVMKVTEKLLTG